MPADYPDDDRRPRSADHSWLDTGWRRALAGLKTQAETPPREGRAA